MGIIHRAHAYRLKLLLYFWQLVADYSIDKKVLPPKKLIGNTNDNFIHKRRLALEKYLQYLLQQFRLLPYQLALFLDFQKYVSSFDHHYVMYGMVMYCMFCLSATTDILLFDTS